MRVLLRTVILMLVLFSGFVYGQRIEAEVELEEDALPQDKREKLRDFPDKVMHYLNSHDWSDDPWNTPVYINVQLILSDKSSGAEERYDGKLLIHNNYDVQFFDQRWRFAYQSGDMLIHSEGTLDSFTSMLDFYIYLILGFEFDKWGTLAGNAYFEKAKQIAEQSKFGLGRFINGWDRRLELVERLLSDPHRSYREMVDYYYYGLSFVNQNNAKAREHVATAVERLDNILRLDPENEYAKKFIDAHYMEMLEIYRRALDKSPLRTLMVLDPSHQRAYQEILNR
jgi:hypothetical protein